MRSALIAILALAAQEAAAHAVFERLWVDGEDLGTTCIRMPPTNSPVSNLSGSDIRCNVGGTRGVEGKCPVKAGGSVTIEMHELPRYRDCRNEAIGGNHYGPVVVFMTKVDNAAAADGSTPWFKTFEVGWSSTDSARGVDDNWGVKDLNACCGKMDVPIPKDIPDGDYLLRAEVIALHTADISGGAQMYISCFQITVSGGGDQLPTQTVEFPGAYEASDPGILVNIYSRLASYTIPGGPVIPGGTVKVAGSGCEGCAKTCKRDILVEKMFQA